MCCLINHYRARVHSTTVHQFEIPPQIHCSTLPHDTPTNKQLAWSKTNDDPTFSPSHFCIILNNVEFPKQRFNWSDGQKSILILVPPQTKLSPFLAPKPGLGPYDANELWVVLCMYIIQAFIDTWIWTLTCHHSQFCLFFKHFL